MIDEAGVPGKVRGVLAGLAGRDGLAIALASRLSESVESYARFDPNWDRVLVDVCHELLAAILGQLDDNGLFDTEAAYRGGAEQAEARIPLTAVMEAYRIGSRFIWETLVEACDAGGVSSAELVAVADRLWQAQDQFTQAMTDGYRERATADRLTREAERAAVVEALLQGQLLSQEMVWDVATALRLPTSGPFVVVAAHVAQLGRHALPEVENRLLVKDVHSAWRLRPDVQVGIVCLPTARSSTHLTDVLQRYSAVRQGVSPRYDDLDETGRAVRLARIAMTAAPAEGGLVVFDDQPLLVASVAEPEVMRRISANALAPLASMRPEDRAILLETLESWIDNQGSAEGAAGDLFCHPNTVRQRLRRLEERTGRSLGDPRYLAELCLAIETERRIGPSSLAAVRDG